jgi:hypothetical protein
VAAMDSTTVLVRQSSTPSIATASDPAMENSSAQTTPVKQNRRSWGGSGKPSPIRKWYTACVSGQETPPLTEPVLAEAAACVAPEQEPQRAATPAALQSPGETDAMGSDAALLDVWLLPKEADEKAPADAAVPTRAAPQTPEISPRTPPILREGFSGLAGRPSRLSSATEEVLTASSSCPETSKQLHPLWEAAATGGEVQQPGMEQSVDDARPAAGQAAARMPHRARRLAPARQQRKVGLFLKSCAGGFDLNAVSTLAAISSSCSPCI